MPSIRRTPGDSLRLDETAERGLQDKASRCKICRSLGLHPTPNRDQMQSELWVGQSLLSRLYSRDSCVSKDALVSWTVQNHDSLSPRRNKADSFLVERQHSFG